MDDLKDVVAAAAARSSKDSKLRYVYSNGVRWVTALTQPALMNTHWMVDGQYTYRHDGGQKVTEYDYQPLG